MRAWGGYERTSECSSVELILGVGAVVAVLAVMILS